MNDSNMRKMKASKTILVVDDSKTLRAFVITLLSQDGYRTTAAKDGVEALQVLYRVQPDLVILDIMMPNMDGLEVLHRIRELSDVPVLILSAKDDEEDKVKALQQGADDYVTKPFGSQELVARVDALLRRSARSSDRHDNEMTSVCDGEIVIKPRAHLVLVQGEIVKLTPREYDLLYTLAAHAGAVLPHETIIRQVWGYDYEGDVSNLKLYILYLRRKIEPDPKQPRYILTERGIGYLLAK